MLTVLAAHSAFGQSFKHMLCVQIMLRQLPESIGETMAWRTEEKRDEDDLVRSTGARLRRFNYTTAATIARCEDFLREDTSINILEHIAPTLEDDRKDSDRVLIERMRAYRRVAKHDALHDADAA
jgi:hypothetical protein